MNIKQFLKNFKFLIMKKKNVSILSQVGKSGMNVTFTTLENLDPENIGMKQKINLSSPIIKGEKIKGIFKIYGRMGQPVISTTEVVRITNPNEKKFKIITGVSILEAEFE